MATDPVCGMAVKESEAAGKAVHAGEAYYFCSSRCLEQFNANPSAYAHPRQEAVPLKMAVGQSHDAQGSASAAGDRMSGAAVHAPGMAAAAPLKTKSAKELAKDPICGMVVEKGKSLKTERAAACITFAAPVASARSNRPSRN